MIQPILEISWNVEKYSLSKLSVDQWGAFLKANGRPRKSIVFCASVAQAEMFANIINRAIPDCAEFVCESTPKIQRKSILRHTHGI